MNIPFLLYLFAVIASLIGPGYTSSIRNDLFPDVVDTSHASPLAAKFFQGYFTAKSLHHATSWLEIFHPTQFVYYDATLGIGFPSTSLLVKTFTELTQEWQKNATSYALQILGDTSSAVVHYVDTPGLFGAAEIRSISAVDFRDGKVTRQVDYWDGRRNPDDTASPNSQFPYGSGVETVDEQAAPEINRRANQLNAALAANDPDAAVALFSYDAIWMDITLRTTQEGQPAISRYHQRALARLPYGSGATLRHVLGSIQGEGMTGRPKATLR